MLFVFRTKHFDFRTNGGVQGPVPEIRYAQFCPLTRAAEILGERWTILIVRELLLGPKRFSDLKAALNGVSPSVLADRLSRLEEKGILRKRDLPPPAASVVYELDEAGRAAKALLIELTRWGLRFLGPPGPGDRIRPEWLVLGLQVFARSGPTEDIGGRLVIADDDESVEIYVRGGASGTVVSRDPLPFEVTISATPLAMLGFASAAAATTSAAMSAEAASAATAAPGLVVEGDATVARRLPSLFDFQPSAAATAQAPRLSPVPPTATAPSARRTPRPAATSGRRKETERP
jgi:DNA-binding HxlR family transcriptional regulator